MKEACRQTAAKRHERPEKKRRLLASCQSVRLYVDGVLGSAAVRTQGILLQREPRYYRRPQEHMCELITVMGRTTEGTGLFAHICTSAKPTHRPASLPACEIHEALHCL